MARTTDSILHLAKLESMLGDVSSSANLDSIFNTNLYGVTDSANRKTLGDIYTLYANLNSGNTTQTQFFGQIINGTVSGTISSITSTYKSMKAIALRLGTIDTLLSLTGVSDSSALDTIVELSNWCTNNASRLTTIDASFLGKSVIVMGSSTFSKDTAGDNDTFAYSTVSIGKTLADATYTVFIFPAGDSAGTLGEYHLSARTTSTFTVAITGTSTAAFDWLVIPSAL